MNILKNIITFIKKNYHNVLNEIENRFGSVRLGSVRFGSEFSSVQMWWSAERFRFGIKIIKKSF